MSALAFPTRAQRLGYAAALSLTLLRLVLAIPFVMVGLTRAPGRMAAGLLAAGFLSDVFDGVIARRFDVATPALRRFDSAVDTVFYLAAGFSVWRLHPGAVVSNRWLIGAVLGTLVINHAVELYKFGREASYHAWSAKAWGASLFGALLVLFATGDALFIPIALLVGIVSHLENLAITLVLREWTHDVPTVFAALAIRR
jgi:CDP-diacylglycerol--glycerol-3-phosphate 3-phosphatidyltransferase